MGNVIPLRKALPVRDLHPQIAKLYEAFGMRHFKIAEAAAVLDIPYEDAIHIGGTLGDDNFQVAVDGGMLRLLRVNPEVPLARRLYARHLTLLQSRVDWSQQEFADAIAVPFATATYVLGLLHRLGYLRRNGMFETYEVKERKRRRVINLTGDATGLRYEGH